MARYSVAALQTTAKTSLRGPTLAVGASNLTLREVGVEATTAVSSTVALRIASALGTSGTALDEVPWAGDRTAPAATAFQAPTADHTAVAGFIRIAALPAAIGGGSHLDVRSARVTASWWLGGRVLFVASKRLGCRREFLL